ALGLKMTFMAYEVSGPNVTSWLRFNSATDDLYGTVPATASGTVQIEVVASDSRLVSAADLFSVTLAPTSSGHTTAAFQTTPLGGATASFSPAQTAVLLAFTT
ncbi:MAG TPA: putative Ig domain-containing protein, partial [Rhodopila sp.]